MLPAMSLRARRSNLVPPKIPLASRDCFVAALLAMTMSLIAPVWGAERQHCVRAEIVLWGDGKHDDTAAARARLGGGHAIADGGGGGAAAVPRPGVRAGGRGKVGRRGGPRRLAGRRRCNRGRERRAGRRVD